MAKEHIKVEKIPTEVNPAKMLTKLIHVAKFEQSIILTQYAPYLAR